MKRKNLVFLLAESIFLCLLCFLMIEWEHIFSYLISFGNEMVLSAVGENAFDTQDDLLIFALSFPFAQIGFLIGKLSALGNIANGIALSLIVLFGAAPLGAFLKNCNNKMYKIENTILFVLCPLSTFVMFAMAKPMVIYNMVPIISEEIYIIMRGILGGTIWSGVLSLAVLKILRLFRSAKDEQLLMWAKRLLFMLCVFFTAKISYTEFNKLLEKLYDITGVADIFVALLGFAVSCLPYALDIVIVFYGCRLIDSIIEKQESERIELYAKKLSLLCVVSLAAVVISGFINNVIQVVLSNMLTKIFVNVNFPVYSLAFVMAILVLSQLVIKNRQLEEDSELFI